MPVSQVSGKYEVIPSSPYTEGTPDMQVETAGQCPGRRTGQGWDGQVGWHHACYGLTHLTLVTTRTRVRKATPTVSYTRSWYMGRAHRPVHIGARLPPTGILWGEFRTTTQQKPKVGKEGREGSGEGRKRGRREKERKAGKERWKKGRLLGMPGILHLDLSLERRRM